MVPFEVTSEIMWEFHRSTHQLRFFKLLNYSNKDNNNFTLEASVIDVEVNKPMREVTAAVFFFFYEICKYNKLSKIPI